MAAHMAEGDTLAYKRRAARWAALNFLKKQKHHLAWGKRISSQPVTFKEVEQSVIEKDERMERFRKIMDALNLRERMVYLLVVFSPFNQAQIGCALNTSDRNLRKIFRRARQKLLPLEKELGILTSARKPRSRPANKQYKGKQE